MQIARFTYIIAGIVLAAGVLFLIYFLRQSSQEETDAWRAVPEDAIMVMEWPEPGTLWNKLTNNTSFWPVIENVDALVAIQQNLNWVDSLFADNKEIIDLFGRQRLLLSLHSQNESFGFLLVAEVGNDLKMNQIRQSIQQRFQGKIELVERGQQNLSSVLIVDTESDKQYTFAIEEGLLIGSFDKELISKALLALKGGKSLKQSTELQRLEPTKGKAAEAYVYLQYDYLAGLLGAFSADAYSSEVSDFLSNLAAWSA
ncbi:MAG TPA: hypothetical protein PKV88_08785, partial [Bacteroidales bacterium]|nr:hypothetical protein [Bacteroidales bacterium]